MRSKRELCKFFKRSKSVVQQYRITYVRCCGVSRTNQLYVLNKCTTIRNSLDGTTCKDEAKRRRKSQRVTAIVCFTLLYYRSRRVRRENGVVCLGIIIHIIFFFFCFCFKSIFISITYVKSSYACTWRSCKIPDEQFKILII